MCHSHQKIHQLRTRSVYYFYTFVNLHLCIHDLFILNKIIIYNKKRLALRPTTNMKSSFLTPCGKHSYFWSVFCITFYPIWHVAELVFIIPWKRAEGVNDDYFNGPLKEKRTLEVLVRHSGGRVGAHQWGWVEAGYDLSEVESLRLKLIAQNDYGKVQKAIKQVGVSLSWLMMPY